MTDIRLMLNEENSSWILIRLGQTSPLRIPWPSLSALPSVVPQSKVNLIRLDLNPCEKSDV